MKKLKKDKILVWDGIFKGYHYITKEEVKERKVLQKQMKAILWKFAFWFIVISLGILFLFVMIVS